MLKKYKIKKNWKCKDFDTIIDVRSPSEFEEDHIVGAINCPVLSDLEREKVGTIYKRESTFKAKIIGSSLTARNIAKHIEEKFSECKGSWQPLIYCWSYKLSSFIRLRKRESWYYLQKREYF